MEAYKYIEHTADAKFQAFGKTLEEAFTNAALATFNIMTDTTKVKPNIKKEIKIGAHDMNALLYDFLDELLFFLDTEGFLLNKIENIKIDTENFKLEATALGDSHKGYEVHGNVKSPTYNDMKVEEKDGQWMVQAVVDI